MLILNTPYYQQRDLASQIHSGSADFLPDPGNPGEEALLPGGANASLRQLLPASTVGAAWCIAPPPGQSGNSHELLAWWSGLPNPFPTDASDFRLGGPVRVRDRTDEDTWFTQANFKAAVAARQVALGRNVPCIDATGARWSNLNPAYDDGSAMCETRDIFREGDGTPVGEAFLFRQSAVQTQQHWVLFNDERFTQVRIVKRLNGGYASLTAFFNSLASRRPAGVSWPHTVETCTHYAWCPW